MSYTESTTDMASEVNSNGLSANGSEERQHTENSADGLSISSITVGEVNHFLRNISTTTIYELPILGNSPTDKVFNQGLSWPLNMVIMNRGQYWPTFPTTVQHTRDKILRIEEYAPEGYNNPVFGRRRRLQINRGENLGSRYVIEDCLGSGTYGNVYCARDRATLKLVAIKANRSSDSNRVIALRELRVLNMIALNDPESKNRCLRVVDSFKFRGHICIATPLHGMSLMDFMEVQTDQGCDDLVPLPLSHIRSITRQLLSAVAFLHHMHIIHGDIKLDNIVIGDSNHITVPYARDIPSILHSAPRRGPATRSVLCTPDIRLIDFGCVVFPDEDSNPGLSTAQLYFPPEAIVGDMWSYPADIWSIGCIMVEMLTGQAAFHAENDVQRMAVMESMLGPIPTEMAERWQHAVLEEDEERNESIRFFRNGMLNFPNDRATPESCSYVYRIQPLQAYGCAPTYFACQYVDLVRHLLNFNQHERLTALNALSHPWFDTIVDPDDGTRAAERLWQGRTLQQVRDAQLRIDLVNPPQ